MIATLIAWFQANAGALAAVFAALFALSEALAQIPSVKANSVFQAIQGALSFVMGLFKK